MKQADILRWRTALGKNDYLASVRQPGEIRSKRSALSRFLRLANPYQAVYAHAS